VWLPGLCLAIGLSGCLKPAEVLRLERPTPVALAVVVDDVHQREAGPAPEALWARLAGALLERNLVARRASAEALADFGRVRDTAGRLARLGALDPEAEAVLLVETQAVFYSQLAGRYRWTVYARLTLADRAAPQAALSERRELPVVLDFAHQRESEALEAAAESLARRVAALADDYVGGRLTPGRAVPPATSRAAGSSADAIYFVLVDRFRNGEPANDGQVDPADPAAWHGGDLQGVLEELPRLEALGVRTLWLSPVFQTRERDFMGHGAFHGYWVEDLGRVDARFGGEAALGRLLEETRARGMRVLLDWVVNHVGYEAPLVRERPDWFHPHGTIRDWDDPVQVVTHEVHGLPDLDQSRPEVVAYLLDSARRWLELPGVDGFRLDAVKHVGIDFWRLHNRELQRLRPGLMLLGEHYDGAPRAVEEIWRQGGFTHMFDFPLAFALRDVFCQGRPAGLLGAVLGDDRLYADPHALVTFLDNHDLPRVRTACGGELARVERALVAMLALRGTPCLTYGTEAGLAGGEEPHNRGDQPAEIPAEARPLERTLREMLGLRARHPALVRGVTRVLAYEDGLLTLARVLPDEAFVLLVNSSARPRAFVLPAPLGEGRVSPVLDGPAAGPRLELAPGEVRLVRVLPGAPGAFEALARPGPGGSRRVDIRVRGAALAAGEALLLVGNPPELGAWRPALGLGPLAPQGGELTAEVALPPSQVYAYKLVVRGADGRERWEQGENRFLFVPEGEGPLGVRIEFRQS
jgi:glycosidase